MIGNDDNSRSLRLVDWKPLVSGALLGRAAVEINGLIIADIGVFAHNGSRWTQLPAEPQRDLDGQLVRDDRGKVKYRRRLTWQSRSLQEWFREAVIAAIEAAHGPIGDGAP